MAPLCGASYRFFFSARDGPTSTGVLAPPFHGNSAGGDQRPGRVFQSLVVRNRLCRGRGTQDGARLRCPAAPRVCNRVAERCTASDRPAPQASYARCSPHLLTKPLGPRALCSSLAAIARHAGHMADHHHARLSRRVLRVDNVFPPDTGTLPGPAATASRWNTVTSTGRFITEHCSSTKKRLHFTEVRSAILEDSRNIRGRSSC